VSASALGASVPRVVAGDFEAEYRGAMEHAHSVVLNALHAALSSGKVGTSNNNRKLKPLFLSFYFSFIF
jgi:hypothetical protein